MKFKRSGIVEMLNEGEFLSPAIVDRIGMSDSYWKANTKRFEQVFKKPEGLFSDTETLQKMVNFFNIYEARTPETLEKWFKLQDKASDGITKLRKEMGVKDFDIASEIAPMTALSNLDSFDDDNGMSKMMANSIIQGKLLKKITKQYVDAIEILRSAADEGLIDPVVLEALSSAGTIVIPKEEPKATGNFKGREEKLGRRGGSNNKGKLRFGEARENTTSAFEKRAVKTSAFDKFRKEEEYDEDDWYSGRGRSWGKSYSKGYDDDYFDPSNAMESLSRMNNSSGKTNVFKSSGGSSSGYFDRDKETSGWWGKSSGGVNTREYTSPFTAVKPDPRYVRNPYEGIADRKYMF